MDRLTRRELEVLARLAEGDSYKEIAQRLGISVQTVNDHTKQLYRKLEVHSRAQAAARYLRGFGPVTQQDPVATKKQRTARIFV